MGAIFERKTSIKLMILYLNVMSCVRCEEITVRGHEGGDAVINCTYQKGYESYTKYLLIGECKDGDDVIRSNGRAQWTHRGRVSLQDKKNTNIFTVTIHNLTLEDSGIYVCGVIAFETDYITRVKLTVLSTHSRTTRPQSKITESERTTHFQSDPTSSSGVSCVTCEEITVTGHEGGNVVINCPYQKGSESSAKYLRKGEFKDGVDVIRSSGHLPWTQSGRLSLQDRKDTNVFTVTMRNLTPKDAGIYVCGVHTFGTHYITRVKLTVLLSCVSCEEITVRGYERGDAVINCAYQKGYESNKKYLLKGEFKDGVEIIRSNWQAEWSHSGRVSLQDKKNENIFTVTIHDLTLEDAGIYGCGVDIQGTHFFTRVNLTVVSTHYATTRPLSNITERTTHLQSDPTSASGDHLAHLSGGLVAAVVMFAVVVVAFRLMKSRADEKGASPTPLSGNMSQSQDSCVYSEIQPTSPHATDGPDQSDQRSSSFLTTIYALATHPAPDQHPASAKGANQIPQPTTSNMHTANQLPQPTTSNMHTANHLPQPTTDGDDIYYLLTNPTPALNAGAT
ncbi:polymeric immunoglobulin receptor-like [Alosa pseudoharengus]|uniref:polymeric immunoglobulin receptor-like n=1 Tax=Alosa pseudoharengus TaxID=34774 RepID=UPI003F8CB895